MEPLSPSNYSLPIDSPPPDEKETLLEREPSPSGPEKSYTIDSSFLEKRQRNLEAAAKIKEQVDQDLKQRLEGDRANSPADFSEDLTITFGKTDCQTEGELPVSKKNKTIHKEYVPSLSYNKYLLRDKIIDCFPSINPELIQRADHHNLIALCYAQAEERLRSVEAVEEREIQTIYSLLFGPELQEESHAMARDSHDPCYPHVCKVYLTLHSCLERVKGYSSFLDLDAAGTTFLSQHPKLKKELENSGSFYNFETTLRKSPQSLISKECNSCPIFRTSVVSNNQHPAFILRDEESRPCWIFKPALPGSSQKSDLCKAKNEHIASLLNFDHLFPIPLTIFVSFKGVTGSMQYYLDNTQVGIGTSYRPIANDTINQDIQRLFVFDLLAANSDRHRGNLLVAPKESPKRAYGIDHGDCFLESREALKMEYLTHPALQGALEPELAGLISEEICERYAAIMSEQGLENSAVEWMRLAAKQLREDMGGRLSAKEIHETLKNSFLKKLKSLA